MSYQRKEQIGDPTDLQIRAAISLRREIIKAMRDEDNDERDSEILLWLLCLSNVQIHEMTSDAASQGSA